jgi:hypothetical protein
MAYSEITCKADPLLVVHIDRSRATAPVTYTYDDCEKQSTPYQTADMPIDDQRAAQMVNEWLS